MFAKLLGTPEEDISQIGREYPGQEILTVLRIWLEREGPRATGDNLSNVLKAIEREDVVIKLFKRQPPVAIDYERLATVAPVHGKLFFFRSRVIFMRKYYVFRMKLMK